MRDSGEYDLGTYALTAAVTGHVITSQPDRQSVTQAYLDGMERLISALISINFGYGSGGTTCRVLIETSPDGGTTWIEVWRALFATASEQNVVNLTHAELTTPYTPAALSDDATKNGILGRLWRAKVTSTGTYVSPTTVSVRLTAKMGSP